jgi:hypothetical protein
MLPLGSSSAASRSRGSASSGQKWRMEAASRLCGCEVNPSGLPGFRWPHDHWPASELLASKVTPLRRPLGSRGPSSLGRVATKNGLGGPFATAARDLAFATSAGLCARAADDRNRGLGCKLMGQTDCRDGATSILTHLRARLEVGGEIRPGTAAREEVSPVIRTLAMVVIAIVALAAPAPSVSKPKPPRHRHHQVRPRPEIIVIPPGWSYQRLPKHWAGD